MPSPTPSPPPSPSGKSAHQRRKMPPYTPPRSTSDGTYSAPPALRAPAPPPPPPPEPDAALKALPQGALIARLQRAEALLGHYARASGDLLSALALTPDMTEAFYARSLRALLADALRALDAVDDVTHVECSFPCVAHEAPRVALVAWAGLACSEWRVEWEPASWWVSASAEGSRWGFGFSCLTNVTRIRLRGVLRCAFSEDMTAVRVGFRETPELGMAVESVVGWGAVPIPVRESIVALVREEITTFVRERLTEDDVVLVLRRKSAGMSDGDLTEASLAASRAQSVNLRASTLL